MSTRYDPQILQKFADTLYSKADRAVFICVIFGVVIGGFVGFLNRSIVAMVISVVILGALGFAVGMSIAFQLRLRAQMVLCQKQIEENTRKTVEHSSPSATTTSPVAPMLSNTNARYYYSTDGEQQQGPVDASDLRMMRKDGIITDDVLVLREGEKQWHKFRDYLELNR
jgi:hypothetical protein